MSKIKPGNKQNAVINGEWAKHVRRDGKKITAGMRRALSKALTRAELLAQVD